MSNKQNNDDSENGKQVLNSSKITTLRERQHADHSQQQSLADMKLSSKKQSQKSSKAQNKQSQLPIPASSFTPAPQAILPITIHQLQEKTLNLYMKQFMQISSFQTIQKGKQLIELIKQSPGSKQTTSVINKCFKLFKSSIPDAVLCSLQFFRELIEIGYWKITDVLQELLLMPIVEIIEYRAYVKNIERGNSYFLGQIYRYGQDDKTNHLVKIGSTFFRMVHQVLYVWGTFYFPESNFNKMLTKLIKSQNIQFPKYPQQFRFYSQARVQLFKNILERNKKLNQKEEEQFKRKKSNSLVKNLQKSKEIEKVQKNNQPKVIVENDEKAKLPKKTDSQQTTPNNVRAQVPIKEHQQPKQQIINQPLLKKQQQFNPKVLSNKTLQNQTNKLKTENTQNLGPQLESIQLKNLLKQNTQKPKDNTSQKNIQSYKKIKPNKIKSKKSKFSINASEKSIQIINSRAQSLVDTYNALNLIEQVQQIEIFQSNDQKYQPHNSPKQSSPKSPISKQMLRIDLKKLRNERSQSQMCIKNSPDSRQAHYTHAEQTFRPVHNQDKRSRQEIYNSNENSLQKSTMRELTSQRLQRQRFNQMITEESAQRCKGQEDTLKQINPQNNITNENVMKEFFKKELQLMKISIIDGIKKDIVQLMEEKEQLANIKALQFNKKDEVKEHSQSDKQSSKKQLIQENMVSGRFGSKKTQEDMDPSIEAFQFIKRKFKSGKKLRTSSKFKRISILQDIESNQKQQQQNLLQVKQNSIRESDSKVIKSPKKVAQLAVNTESFSYQKLYEQINSLKEKIDVMTAAQSAPKPLSVKRQNNFFQSPVSSNSFFKTPYAINKNQLQYQRISQNSSLRSTLNTTRKKSKSKLSERRSSLETSLMEKAVLRPQNCRHLFEYIYGNSNTLLFNAAISSVQKKRKSVMFC